MPVEKPRLTFISYSRTDKEFALELARELRASGFLIWLDLLDIPAGARWDDEIEKALDQCEIFMVILTPESAASDNVKDEIGYAIDCKKRIMPVLLENAVLPLRLRRFQYVDFTSKSKKEGIEAAKELLRNLGSKPILSGGTPGTRVRDTRTPIERISAEHSEEGSNTLGKPSPEQLPRNKKEQPGQRPSSTGGKGKSSWITWAAALLGAISLFVCMLIAWSNWDNLFSQEPAPLPAAGQTATLLLPTDIKTDIVVDAATSTPIEVTPTFTPTFTPTATATETSTATPFAPQEPDQFIFFYFETIIYKRDYQLAWSLLTETFKSRNNPEGFEAWKTTWEKVVEWKRPSLIRMASRPNTVLFSAPEKRFRSSSWYSVTNGQFCLIRDENRNTWMIESPSVCRQ